MSGPAISRRQVLICGFVFAVYPVPGSTQALTTLAGLEQLANVIGASADAVSKLGDSIAHVSSLGMAGYDEVSARSTHRRLIDIRARLVDIHGGYNRVILEDMQKYIHAAKEYNEKPASERDPRLNRMWRAFLYMLPGPLDQIRTVLDDVKKERSDFVLEQSYEEIIASLNARVTIIEELQKLPAPTSPKEIAALEKVVSQYDRLRKNLVKASVAFAEYLKKSSSTGSAASKSEP